ncbi:MAG: EAL domain-containing protein [Negativicutes bacterium]|nr:EAL domain-containing protein [Negativicutes bacterium]
MLSAQIRDARWVVIFLCAAVLAWSWISTFIWVEEEYQTEMQNIRREHSNLTRALEEHVRRTVGGVDEILVLVKEEYEKTGRVTDTIESYLKWARSSPVLNGQMSIVDKNGSYIASALPTQPYDSLADRQHFQAHVERQTGVVFIDQPVLGRASGRVSVNLSRRIDKPDGSFGGVVSAAVDPQYFARFYERMNLGRSQNVLIVGLDGIVRARQYQGQTEIGQDFSQSAVLKYASESPEGVFEVAGFLLTREDRIQAYRVMPDYPLIVNVGIGKTDALAAFTNRKQRQYAETTLFTLLVLVFGGFLIHQINKQQAARRESELQKARLGAMLDNIPHVAWFKDIEGRYLVVNNSFLTTVGLTRDAVVGKMDAELWPAEIAANYLAEDREVIATGQRRRTEGKALTRGDEFWEEIYKAPVFGPRGEILGSTGLALDITDRKLREEEIRRMAYFDPLTGLPNRTHIKMRLEEELEKARRGLAAGAVLFIDMDDLKMVNDTFGHTYGDHVITMASAYIAAAVGEGAVVARIGGDEFIVLLASGSDRKKITAAAERLIKALNRDYDIGDARPHMSASIGISVYPENGDTAEELFKNADIALYAAKGSGKNAWRFYDANMQKTSSENMVLKHSLRGAIERGELSLHYQPQVAVVGEAVVGFEALLRWTSIEHGSVPPGRFIPLAEESDVIHVIGSWVLKEACRFARRLADLGQGELSVAVNVSPRQLAAADFVAIVQGAITAAGISPGQLELEITENLLIGSMEDSIGKLREIKNYGVRLSLDDFGTGYSSLTYLRSLPVDTLKIDKSFIDNILLDKAQLALVASIVDMAHVLGLTVVAEGVETKQQLQQLIHCRCDWVQGYVYSRPIIDAEAIVFLDR